MEPTNRARNSRSIGQGRVQQQQQQQQTTAVTTRTATATTLRAIDRVQAANTNMNQYHPTPLSWKTFLNNNQTESWCFNHIIVHAMDLENLQYIVQGPTYMDVRNIMQEHWVDPLQSNATFDTAINKLKEIYNTIFNSLQTKSIWCTNNSHLGYFNAILQSFLLGEYGFNEVELNTLSNVNREGCLYIQRRVHEEGLQNNLFLIYGQITSVIIAIRNYFSHSN